MVDDYGRGFRALALITACVTFALVVIGGTVRVTESGLGCPDWPTCYGQVVPPPDVHAVIEYSHRAVAGAAGLLVLVMAVAVIRRHRSDRPMLGLALLSLGAVGVQSLIGRTVVVANLPPAWVWIHLGMALALFATVVAMAAIAWRRPHLMQVPLVLQRRLTLVAAASAVAIYVSILLGATVVNTGASMQCGDWPLCQGQLIPDVSNSLVMVNFTHRIAAFASGALVLGFAVATWRVRRSEPGLARWALGLAAAYAIQVLVGGAAVLAGMSTWLRVLHLAAATLVWGLVIVIVVRLLRDSRAAQAVASRAEVEVSARPAGGSASDVAMPGQAAGLRLGLAKYVRLTKPWIIALLLTTTLTSMLVAGKGSVPLALAVFTLLGGALASAGANAINCYVDRDIDGVMSRTKNRPVPRDQISPRQALGFGLAASLASFLILVVFVNLLAATLAVFGILYYVVVYTLWLKRSTPHNIVIGGIAGAVPPLVGWAAVTGRIDLLALYLFLIVFFWTPPHTWALGILVRGDYERAGVPMLPVVAGEAETRKWIGLYSLQMVAVTLLVYAFQMLGWIYLCLALALNGLFLWLAFRLVRRMDKPAAKRLYKYSQLYLALLFAAMVIDAALLA